MNRVRCTRARSGVYTFSTVCLLALLTIFAPVDAQAPPESGADPAMTKGPAKAAVTIVEFSDYQ